MCTQPAPDALPHEALCSPVAILRVGVKDEGACTGHTQAGSRLGCRGHDLVAGSKADASLHSP